ncbi:acyltransferase family protein [Parapedobacter koreensis]|uniref:Fucose 4-O-acetylase n=1 Tax=Parapedobacter koreensis TaxID=332977 RepID=A0A1H7IKG5_9SPHI|nr:acyltransferase family protein [Parapedobacter koreensis]SEK62217.1 Fucose 4-O-acetylase [Parapedobacter koreensis]
MANTSVTKNSKRILWIDYAKFIGITLVVCAHHTGRGNWFAFISAFALPLFFFLSGYLFSFKKFDNYTAFLKARTKQLLIPYFILNFVTYILWLFFFRRFDYHYVISEPLYTPFIGIFYGNGHEDWLIHSIASWFIICLFVLENIYFLLFRNVTGARRYVLLAGILAVCFIDQKYDPIRWPWSLNIAIIGIVFYGVANMLKENVNKIMALSLPKLITLSACSGFLLYVISSRNFIDMNKSTYDSFTLFFMGAFSGILFALTLSRVLEMLLGPVWLFQYLAQNTLVIIAFHLMVMSVVKKAISMAFQIPDDLLTDNLYLNFTVVAATLLLSLPIIYICNKYLPVMVGRPAKPKQRDAAAPQVISNSQTV